MFRRRSRSDPDRERLVSAFRTCAARVGAAQRALLAAIPTPRDEGSPIAEAIDEFLAHLDSAEVAMESWNDTSLRHEWTSCRSAIDAARAEAGRLRAETGLGFEALNARVGDVIYPLEAFAEAAPAVRRLGRDG